MKNEILIKSAGLNEEAVALANTISGKYQSLSI